MKTRPILFSAPMVRAILDGTKTQTRRIVKYIPELGGPEDWCPGHLDPFFIRAAGDVWKFCPYGKTGDRLWVRETWAPNHRAPAGAESMRPYVLYRANGDGDRGQKWRPSIFMPRAASRITLEIVAVRVERVQAITEADATAEGTPAIETRGEVQSDGTVKPLTLSARDCYRSLWSKINGPASWEINPFVWVLTFGRVSA